MNCVTWSQARTFAKWAGGDLPTEAQWEYAAREGMNQPKGSFLTSSEEAWYKQNSNGVSHPVKKKSANRYGLYDMYGNLSEWTLDEYHKDYVNAPSKAEIAWGELLPCSGVCENKIPYRVYRGGDFHTPQKSIGFYKRSYGYKTDWQTISIGFRVLRTQGSNKGAVN